MTAAPPPETAPADLLRLAASGRREYAASGGPHTELLEAEAATFEQAARIVEGDLWALQGVLPSWRWMQIPSEFTERGLYGPPTEQPDRTLPSSREELAEFFGPIRLPNGANATGIFVQAALDAIAANVNPPPAPSPPAREEGP